MTKLLDWINSTPPTWANDVIAHWNSVFSWQEPADMRLFIHREISESNTGLDMRTVVGQWDHYAGQTWLGAIQSPKLKPGKIHSCLRLYEENPEYYFNGEVANGISVDSLNGGPWYSHNSGNHRTIIAKFACQQIEEQTGHYPMVQGVRKHHYYVDMEAWSLASSFHQSDRTMVGLKVRREKCAEYQTEEGHVFEYVTKFSVRDSRFGKDARFGHLGRDDFVQYARWVLQNEGALTRTDKLRHHWHSIIGNHRGLLPVRRRR